jgi:Zn finger protein HypA/HybF involved in hydrogenase expression
MGMYKIYKCINCGVEVKKANTQGKYCSNKCQADHRLNVSIQNGTAKHRTLKRYLVKTSGNKCWTCGITNWNNKPIVMELEHIDGNSTNNNLDNLSLICPNCHSQTPTYKAKNIGNGRHSRRQRYAEGKSY